MKSLCIYHGNCADGFASAWVVRKALLETNVEFYPGVHQNPPPDCIERNVIIVDFSYKRAVMEKICQEARSVTLLDHHKSAIDDLQNLDMKFDNLQAIFDIERSGARITWDYYFPDTPPPQLLRHIEDRDLWRFALHSTREIQAAVFSYPYDFKVWDWLMQDVDMAELCQEGAAIERKHHKDIAELIEVTTRWFTIGGYIVPIANLPYTLTSDAGHLLCEKYAMNAPYTFAGCYWDTPDGRVFSLRSLDNGMDVAEIAAQYGGGGHKNASGFRVPFGHELAA